MLLEYFKIKKCRLYLKLKQIHNFGNIYLSNFVNKKILKMRAPLNLVYCKKCELLQLEHSRNNVYKVLLVLSHLQKL